MKTIALLHGSVAIVDDADYANLAALKWRESYKHGHTYAETGRRALMHRIIMNPAKGLHVDHINGNGLDNRRSNLRVVTSSQNQMNRGLPKNNKSGHKGVHWSKLGKRWHAAIVVDRKKNFLGTFTDKEKAAAAYREAAEKLHGEFRQKN